MKTKPGLFEFIINNKTKCYNAFKLGIQYKDYKTTAGRTLIEAARRVLKYSDKTYSGDIYRTLWKAYEDYINGEYEE